MPLCGNFEFWKCGIFHLVKFQIDIEGSEVEILFNWLKTGLLQNVKQIGVEFHNVSNNLQNYANLVKDLDSAGFRIFAMDPNLVFDAASRPKNSNNLFGDYFEIAFRKVDDSDFLKCR